MTIIDSATFRNWYRTDIPGDQDLISIILAATDEGVQFICKRQFVVASESSDDATTRAYVPEHCTDVLRIHDCTSVVAVVENGVTLTAGVDYQTEPVQQIAWTGDVKPYEQLRRLNRYWHTDGPRATVTVTALWGLAAIPSSIKTACLVGAKDLADTRDVKLGIASVNEFALRVRENPEVRRLCQGWVRTVESVGIA